MMILPWRRGLVVGARMGPVLGVGALADRLAAEGPKAFRKPRNVRAARW